MKRSSSSKAFTIIELLVVVSIIALLVGILLPAIGKARDQAQLTKSNANIKNLVTAMNTYAAEFADRQFTAINDNLSKYGDDPLGAFTNYKAQVGDEHPWLWLGYGRSPTDPNAGVVWGYRPPPDGTSISVFTPILFQGAGAGFGSFRLPNVRAISTYVNGRFYDPTYYAPKDTQVFNATEPHFNNPDEFFDLGPGQTKFSSYCLSPAAMYAPQVFGRAGISSTFYNNPWQLDGGFRCPGIGQAAYPDLKTHVAEHNWCQNRKKPCNPEYPGIGPYDNCTPYYFNHAFNSQPVTAFYDGHIEGISQQEAMDANFRVTQQTNPSHGLWSIHTPFLGSYGDGASGGYFMGDGQDWTATSYHILTIDGIKGRDIAAR